MSARLKALHVLPHGAALCTEVLQRLHCACHARQGDPLRIDPGGIDHLMLYVVHQGLRGSAVAGKATFPRSPETLTTVATGREGAAKKQVATAAGEGRGLLQHPNCASLLRRRHGLHGPQSTPSCVQARRRSNSSKLKKRLLFIYIYLYAAPSSINRLCSRTNLNEEDKHFKCLAFQLY